MSKSKSKKPVTQILDEQIKEGGEWEEILSNVNREASKRGQTTYDKSRVKYHIKKRLEKDPDYYPVSLTLTEEKIEVEKPTQTDFLRGLIRKDTKRDECIKLLAEEFDKDESWAKSRLATYERAYGPMGKNDEKLQVDPSELIEEKIEIK